MGAQIEQSYGCFKIESATLFKAATQEVGFGERYG